ncbi:MAG TPA: LLM class flavin-dependent oxidoreductase, partial [Candidatus Binataceae bacterium]|nr:LLM class flavin-dependent oxidoreductase [Candidatus Binataceae bacterium]
MGDLFVALGMAASVTKRIKLATGICVLSDRNPLLTAKEAATLDLFSDGRLLLGVGVGSLHDASAIMGIDTRRPWGRMADYVGAMRRLWTSDVSSYKGEFVSFENVLSYPKPRQPNGPPVLIGSVSASESLMR